MSLTLPWLRKALGGGDPRKAAVIEFHDSDMVDLDALKHLADRSACVTLSVQRNRIQDLTGVSGVAKTLKHLNVSSNQLNVMDVSALKELCSLDASHNGLTRCLGLPLTIQLKHLDLSHNMLPGKTFNGLAKLSALVSLDVSHNPINSWPSILCAFPKLQSLNLDATGMSSLPALAAMMSLRTLRACDNHLDQLGFLKGSSVRKLWITNNPDLEDFSPILQAMELSFVECTGCKGGDKAKSKLTTSAREIMFTPLQSTTSAVMAEPNSAKKKKKKKNKKRSLKDTVVDADGQVIAQVSVVAEQDKRKLVQKSKAKKKKMKGEDATALPVADLASFFGGAQAIEKY